MPDRAYQLEQFRVTLLTRLQATTKTIDCLLEKMLAVNDQALIDKYSAEFQKLTRRWITLKQSLSAAEMELHILRLEVPS